MSESDEVYFKARRVPSVTFNWKQLKRATVHNILQKDLKKYLYKILIIQKLKDKLDIVLSR